MKLLPLFVLAALFIYGCNSTKTMTPKNLVSTQWRLESYVNAEGKKVMSQGETATLIFETEMKLAGHSGCNAFGGEYRMPEGKLTAEVFSTKRYCQEAADQENAIFTAFRQGAVVNMEEGKLSLQSRTSQLNYVAMKPGETTSARPSAPQNRKQDAQESKRYSGMMTYYADAATFTDCNDGKRYAVATGQGAWLACERAYLRMQKEPGQPVFMIIDGATMKNPAEEGHEYLLEVTRMVSGDAEGSCP